eukprot:scaffold178_cov255-Pinguiococcus_pyrenoidosus.AAC.4
MHRARRACSLPSPTVSEAFWFSSPRLVELAPLRVAAVSTAAKTAAPAAARKSVPSATNLLSAPAPRRSLLYGVPVLLSAKLRKLRGSMLCASDSIALTRTWMLSPISLEPRKSQT